MYLKAMIEKIIAFLFTVLYNKNVKTGVLLKAEMIPFDLT